VKQWLRFGFFTACVLALTVGNSSAEQDTLHNGLSLQGYTGILNTPNAQVTDEGWLYALYTNQKEFKWRKRVPYQDNYQFSVGFFNFIELGGRFFEASNAGRDLSANVKLSSAALTKDQPLVPVLALGIQDLGGGAALLRTKYLVLSEEIWRLRLSVGYGKGPDRMKGVFAGGEFKLHDWVYLLGEYDTNDTNLGARVVLPQFWEVPVRFTASAKTSLNYKPGSFDIAVGFSMPLDFRMHKAVPVAAEPPVRKAEPLVVKPTEAAEVTGFTGGRDGKDGKDDKDVKDVKDGANGANAGQTARLSRLRDSLIAAGFLNVRVGTRDRILVVEYENTIFNHNELDALGLVAGLACEAAPAGLDNLSLVIKRRNIGIATLSVPLTSLREFLAGAQGARDLRDQVLVEYGSGPAQDAKFLGGDRSSGVLETSLILAPGLTTFVGTEFGVFDYLLSFKPELNTQLWKGAVLSARADIPVSWSSNLEDGKPYRSSRQSAQLDRLMLFQALQPVPSVLVQLGGGMVVNERYGMLNEAVWNPGDGAHRLRLVQGWNEDSRTHRRSDLLLGAYRYYFGPLDLSFEAVGGKFWAEDQGYSLELKRFWADTAVSVYYKDSKGLDHKNWRAVGIQFSFPLTPRRDMKPLVKLQVRGSDEWSYAQETTLKNNNINSPRGNLNYLAPYALALNPQPSQALYRSFYNRDRLSAAYLLQHLERLREAWLRYGGSLAR
jgi:hypothetical protein